jgi:HEAT repeats
MHHMRILGVVVLVVGFLTGPALATLIPSIDVPSLAFTSELIVVGRASLTVESSEAPETFIIQADRVLKGAATQGQVVVQLAAQRPGYYWVAEGQYGIFFLRRIAPGQPYTAVDPYHPVIPASPAQGANAGAADPLTEVARTLAVVFTTPGRTLTDPTTGVGNLAAGSPEVQTQRLYFHAAAALKSIPYKTAGPALPSAIASDATMARLWATNVLMSMGRSDEIQSAKLKSLQSVASTLLNPPPDLAFSVYMLGNAMLGEITSAAAVPQMAALLGSSEPAVRSAAAGNLSLIGTSSVVAPLARLALQDESATVRYFAVQGLANATGARARPTRSAYDAAESEMLAFWAEWAKANVR